MGKKPDGSPDVVMQPGPMERYEVGTILDNVQADELAAFPDRFELVEEPEEVPAVLGVQAQETVTADEAPEATAPEEEAHAPRDSRGRARHPRHDG
jgi:hypothetical protein